MKAVNYYIVVDKIKEEPKSTSGFILSENQNQDIRYSKGKVVGVGENVNTIKQDDIVWYDKHAGHGIEFNGNYYYVIKYTDVVIIN
jgi:co-chaperonin GroES (HSP10)